MTDDRDRDSYLFAQIIQPLQDDEDAAAARAALIRAHELHPPMTDAERAAAIRANLGVRPPKTHTGGEPFTAAATIRIHEGFFSVDGAHPDGDGSIFTTTNYQNRLFALSDTGVVVFTGLNTGLVPIRVEATREEPPMLDGEWVGEASIHSEFGIIDITSFEDAAQIRSAAINGPGDYRVRISARGRELHYDGVSDDLDEVYVVQVWPAPKAGPVLLVEPPNT
ncbi:hypothetical protein [Leifsonia sp. Leaf264]|uniref:hypothetical protein n=1 Tax=Leifsonia sp. Leaf264 TaxID=1736314 RepID=UPI0012FB11D0|nr:hypothetical protein [Leifsonia sp. Leaf264]